MTDQRQLIFQSMLDFLLQTIGEATFARAGTIAEFGCGKDGFIKNYKRPQQQAYGIDIRNYADYWAPFDVEYLKSDGRQIPLGDSSLDLMVTHSVLEHVDDLPNSFREIDRVLKPGAFLYATVSPLYYSPNGSHIRTIPDWEHLRPGSKYYLMSEPLERQGAHLNKLTMNQLLGMLGDLPWNIVRMDRKILDKPIPAWLAAEGHAPLDLLTREFRIVLRKQPFHPVVADASPD
jgi:SAM-dependent methyltransferase